MRNYESMVNAPSDEGRLSRFEVERWWDVLEELEVESLSVPGGGCCDDDSPQFFSYCEEIEEMVSVLDTPRRLHALKIAADFGYQSPEMRSLPSWIKGLMFVKAWTEYEVTRSDEAHRYNDGGSGVIKYGWLWVCTFTRQILRVARYGYVGMPTAQ